MYKKVATEHDFSERQWMGVQHTSQKHDCNDQSIKCLQVITKLETTFIV